MKRHITSIAMCLLVFGAARVYAAGPEDKLTQAQELLDEQHQVEAKKLIDAAVVEVQALIVKEPAVAEHRYVLGRAYWMLDDLPKAEAAYREAVRLAPAEVRYYGDLAGVLEAGGKTDEAVALVRKLIELVPKNPRPYGLLGGLYYNAGKIDEALQAFRKGTAVDPNYVLGWANVGQIAQSRGRHAEAVAAFEQVVKIDPADWRAWAKIVQEYQALGNIEERDAARTTLIALHGKGKIDSPMYCREQFVEGGQAVMVFEYFELKGDFAVRYSFDLLDKDGKQTAAKISLGSYEMTNAIARETGKLGKDERLFHLDYYTKGGHETYRFFNAEPTYEETRAMVVKVLRGEMKKMSSTTVVPATQE